MSAELNAAPLRKIGDNAKAPINGGAVQFCFRGRVHEEIAHRIPAKCLDTLESAPQERGQIGAFAVFDFDKRAAMSLRNEPHFEGDRGGERDHHNKTIRF